MHHVRSGAWTTHISSRKVKEKTSKLSSAKVDRTAAADFDAANVNGVARYKARQSITVLYVA